MKKLISLVLIVLMCGVCIVPAYAAQYATADELLRSWGENYPDYVCGVWVENNDHYPVIIAVTDDEAGEAGKQAILSTIEDDASVRFETQKYPYYLLSAIQEELMVYMGEEYGVVSLGVHVYDNCVDVGFYADMAENEETQRMVREITEKYGDKIAIEWLEGRITLTVGGEGNVGDYSIMHSYQGEPDRRLPWIGIAVSVGILATAAMILILHRKRTAVAATSAGTVTVAAGKKPTRREVETAIQNSESTPSPELEDKILSKLDP